MKIYKIYFLIAMLSGMVAPLLHTYINPAAGLSAFIGCIFMLMFGLFNLLED